MFDVLFVFICAFRCVAPKGKGENDYRPLFDIFVNDLLTMTNLPEWPSAELVLKILGGLLVRVYSNIHWFEVLHFVTDVMISLQKLHCMSQINIFHC